MYRGSSIVPKLRASSTFTSDFLGGALRRGYSKTHFSKVQRVNKPDVKVGLAVAERSVRIEAVEVTRRGVHGSENVGISSKTAGENPARRKSKVSWATQIDPGLVGPKAWQKGVADGQLVNIPARRCDYPDDDAD